MLINTLILGILSMGAATVAAAPGACTGACWTHDPAVVKRGDTYYRFQTNNKIEIVTSKSLSGPWTLRGSVVPAGSKIDLNGRNDLWAPDVIKSGNLYYLYYSVSAFGVQDSAIGVASSPTLEPGSWTDLGATGVRSKPGSNYNAIDANLIEVPGEGWKMTFGSFWGDIFQVPMKNPPTKVTGTTGAKQIAFQPAGTHAVEGPFIWSKNGYYYLFFSAGVCCGLDKDRPAKGQEYQIKVCRSKSATGGYVDKAGKSCLQGGGTTVLASNGYTYAPGGQSIFKDGNNDVLVYHYVDTRVGYRDADKKFGWNIIKWSGGWPTV